MNNHLKIEKPISRTAIRKWAGKEFYILKRNLEWMTSNKKWTSKPSNKRNWISVFEHKSFIMRPLKDVDMYLQENKKNNLALAIAHLNGIIIQPGETLSIWKNVGRPTKSKGYLDGLVLSQGQITKGIGGGLCQLGNLMFWIFAHSPLTITERYRHSFDVFPDVNRKVPFGAGATLSYNHIDFQVTNTTEQAFQINLWLDEAYLRGELTSELPVMRTYRIEERNHMMSQQTWGGYSRHNQIFKIETDSFGMDTETLLVENHALMMYNPFLSE